MAKAKIPEIPEGDDFIERWNALDKPDRRRLRRLVRIGRPGEVADEAALAVAYSRYQRTKPWLRFFWFWFVPGLVVAIGAASQIHPIVIGIVLGCGGSAILTRRNLLRAERVNRDLLEPSA